MDTDKAMMNHTLICGREFKTENFFAHRADHLMFTIFELFFHAITVEINIYMFLLINLLKSCFYCILLYLDTLFKLIKKKNQNLVYSEFMDIKFN